MGRQEINKEASTLKDILDQMNLRHLKSIPSKSNRIYIFFKYTWNIFQDHVGLQKKS